MGHEGGDVALTVADARDIVHGTVRIPCRVVCSVRRGVAENDLMIFLEFGECGFVAGGVAIVVRDWNFQDLAVLRGVREGRVRLLDTDVDVAAYVAQAAIWPHRSPELAGVAHHP